MYFKRNEFLRSIKGSYFYFFTFTYSYLRGGGVHNEIEPKVTYRKKFKKSKTVKIKSADQDFKVGQKLRLPPPPPTAQRPWHLPFSGFRRRDNRRGPRRFGRRKKIAGIGAFRRKRHQTDGRRTKSRKSNAVSAPRRRYRFAIDVERRFTLVVLGGYY